ncbi:MAG: SpoIIIAH-like family protein [Clostridia bacterium]|nr:SpoIIIAH-like family protein [Clostridia bacterium]
MKGTNTKTKTGKVNKKKIIVLVSLVALLVATGCLNYFLTTRNAKTTVASQSNDAVTPTFFATYRTDREATRAQEMLYLEDIISSTEADEKTVADAQTKKLSLVGMMETELSLEGLIKSKGFDDCVVTISTDNVNVVVKDAELSLDEASQILNIITSETDYKASNVIIIPYV